MNRKHLLRILARLYPAAWRKRYGDEFEALIEDARPGLGGALDILKGALAMQFTSWTPLRVLAAAKTVMSRRGLTRILRDRDIYRNNLKNMPIEDVIELFKRDIRVSPAPGANGSVFQVRFIYGDPRMAQQVTQTLANSFVEAEPDSFRLVEIANLPQQPINTTFSAKIATVGVGGGLFIGAPLQDSFIGAGASRRPRAASTRRSNI